MLIKVSKLFLILFSIQFSFAQNPKPDCDGSQLEMNMCAKAKYEKADIDLNAVYKSIIAQFDKDIKNDVKDTASLSFDKKLKDKFIASQKTWIKLRDANADLEASYYEGGSMKPLVYFDALRKDTEIRIQYLKELKEDFFEK